MQNEIRNIIRGVIYEHYEISKGVNVYPHLSSGEFPYHLGDGETLQPEDIYYKSHYKHAGNKEVYSFPIEEFNLGLEIESGRLDEPILTIAAKVIDQLQGNPRFYSELSK